jgi:hypothetical protein
MTVRKRHALALMVGATLALSAPPAHAEIEPYAYCPFRVSFDCSFPPLTLKVDGEPKPRALPKRVMAPIAVAARGEIVSADGSQPPALREMVVDLDKNAEIHAADFPSCGLRRLEGRGAAEVRSACRDAIVGRGKALIGVGSSERGSVEVPLTLVNGGVAGSITRLFVHGEIPAPEPVAIVSVAKVEKARKGRYGHTATWRIPSILDGAGSLLELNFQLERGYVSARCIDGKLQGNITKALFRNEGEGPRTSTTLKGTVIRPCTPKP